MDRYYTDSLAAERLRRCYELAPPRVRQYLRAETDFVLERTRPSASVLELGCGYGRVLETLAPACSLVVGIDTAEPSLRLARERLSGAASCRLVCADAAEVPFRAGSFDLVVCIQNGVSALHVDRVRLFDEAIRVTRRGGSALFSSYSERFWEHRLEWFRLQAEHGLVGEIDEAATGNGVIVCEDGFEATTVGRDEFARLAAGRGVSWVTSEVDRSSVFCVIRVGDE